MLWTDIFYHAHLLAGLSTELQENYWTDLQETGMVNGLAFL